MRLIPAQSGWWVVGDRIALVPPHAVDADGSLRSDLVAYFNAHGFNQPADPDRYFLTVLTATACNLGCAYCFQNTAPAAVGTFRPTRIPRALLRPDTTRKVLDFAARHMAAAALERLDILLFGGEPLLNAKGALRLLSDAQAHGLCSASMVTNGTLLTPSLAADLSEAGLTRVQLTFDGDGTSHDTLRVTRAGKPTFARILANLAAASEAAPLEWTLRVNVADPERFDAEQLLASLAARVPPERCLLALHLIDDVGVGYDAAAPGWEQTAASFISWYRLAMEHGFTVPVPRAKEHCSYCSERRGRDGAVVNADGTLYSCWDSAGKAGWEVGHVDTGYLPDHVIAPRWVSCGYDARPRWAPDLQQRFKDRVDGAILERMWAGGKLAQDTSKAA